MKCPCGDMFILADTENWKVPLCVECWIDIGSPEKDPNEFEKD
jgi:hypothetical protein